MLFASSLGPVRVYSLCYTLSRAMAVEIPKAKLKSFVRHVVPGESYRSSNQPANGIPSIATMYFPIACLNIMTYAIQC